MRYEVTAMRWLAKGAPFSLVVLVIWTALGGAAAANPSFQRGRELLDLMEDARALSQFRAALRWPQNTTADRAKIYLYLGITQFNLLDKKAAADSFRRALGEDPQIALPRVTSPDISRLFVRIRAETKGRIAASPPGEARDPGDGLAPASPPSGTAGSAGSGAHPAHPQRVSTSNPQPQPRPIDHHPQAPVLPHIGVTEREHAEVKSAGSGDLDDAYRHRVCVLAGD